MRVGISLRVILSLMYRRANTLPTRSNQLRPQAPQRALWPGDLISEHWLPLCEALGMEEISSPEESLVPIYDTRVREQVAMWLDQQWDRPADMDAKLRKGELQGGKADEVIDVVRIRPWTQENILPPTALACSV
jgi:hypothetical protein